MEFSHLPGNEYFTVGKVAPSLKEPALTANFRKTLCCGVCARVHEAKQIQRSRVHYTHLTFCHTFFPWS